jgi:hypothetical protein
MKLADFKHVFDFPRRRNAVYVVFYVRYNIEKPFYVGETDSFPSRMGDYLRANFKAATDFKVGEAISYLMAQENVRIRVGFHECQDRQSAKKQEEQIIESLHKEGVQLLNDLGGYSYRAGANKVNERTRVRKFCDDNILTTRG